MFTSIALSRPLGAKQCSTPHSKRGTGMSNPETELYIENINSFDAHIIHEGRWMLQGLRIVPAELMLKEHFTPTQLLENPEQQATLDGCIQRLRQVQEFIDSSLESQMYRPLAEAINGCLPSSNPQDETYICKVTASDSAEVGYDAGLQAWLAPDLIITPASPNEPNGTIFSRPMVGGEVKRNRRLDPTIVLNHSVNPRIVDDNGRNGKERDEMHTEKRTTDQSEAMSIPPNGSPATVADTSKMKDGQRKLIVQLLRYAILGQFPTLPYRFLFFFTITGDIARIYKISPTGCQATEPIHYTKLNGAALFAKFLHAIGSSPASSIGLDVGEGMMFRGPPTSHYSTIQDRMKKVAALYVKESGNRAWKAKLRCQPGHWVFDLGKIDSIYRYDLKGNKCKSLIIFRRPIYRGTHIFSRATRCYLGIDFDFLVGKNFEEAISSETNKLKVLGHMHTLKTSWQFSRHTPEVDFHKWFAERRSKSAGPTRVATVLAGGIVSGSLQCGASRLPDPAVATPPAQSISPIPTSDGSPILDQDRGNISQSSFDTPDNVSNETSFYAQAPVPPTPSEIAYSSEGDDEGTAMYNHQVLNPVMEEEANEEYHTIGSPDVPENSTRLPSDDDYSFPKNKALDIDSKQLEWLQKDGHEQSDDDKKREPRELHWLVYKEVGANLGCIRNVKEFAQVIIDIVQAHKHLRDGNILHRDLSSNNVMVDLSSATSKSDTRRGLLIDLDMAQDIENIKQDLIGMLDELGNKLASMRPEITGTLRWMSISLMHAPEPRSWHDLESIMWIAIYYVLRHIEHVSCGNSALSSYKDRADTIDSIFCHDTATNPLEATSRAKTGFLNTSLLIGSCSELNMAIAKIKEEFRGLYSIMEALDTAERNIREIESELKITRRYPPATHYSSNTENDLVECIDILQKRKKDAEELLHPEDDKWRFPIIDTTLQMATTMVGVLKFPTHDSMTSQFKSVLESPNAQNVEFHHYNWPGKLMPSQALGQQGQPKPSSASNRVGSTSSKKRPADRNRNHHQDGGPPNKRFRGE